MGQHVACDLLHGELVERHIAVEGVDHPVPVFPDGAAAVRLVAVGVGIAREIQPEPRPALAEVRRSEQPIHQLLVGVRAAVRHEVVHFLHVGRQPGQVEAQTADQRFARGLRRGREFLPLQPRQDEGVDGIAYPRRPCRPRHGRPHRLHVGPVFLRLRLPQFGLVGPHRPGVDPPAQQADLGIRQRLAGKRHTRRAAEARHPLDEPAVTAAARHDRRAGRAARHRQRPGIEVQPCHGPGPRVAPVAGGPQQRLDVLPVIGRSPRHLRCGRARPNARGEGTATPEDSIPSHELPTTLHPWHPPVYRPKVRVLTYAGSRRPGGSARAAVGGVPAHQGGAHDFCQACNAGRSSSGLPGMLRVRSFASVPTGTNPVSCVAP